MRRPGKTKIYSLSADSVQSGSANPVQGSWVSVRRNNDGSFDKGINANTVQNNGAGSTNNIDSSSATGIVVKP